MALSITETRLQVNLSSTRRITFLSPSTFKVEYSPTGEFIDKELFLTYPNDLQQVTATITKTGDTLSVSTGELVVRSRGESALSANTFSVTFGNNKKRSVWYYGKKDEKNLGGSMLQLFKFPRFTHKKDMSEGALSCSGYFVWSDNTQVYWNEDRTEPTFLDLPGYQTLYFTCYGKDFKKGLQEFSRIFGKAVLPPSWAFGFWYSRWWDYNQDEFIELVEKYRSLNIPLDVLVIDTDWRKFGWNGYDWNEKYFPNKKSFFRTLRAMKVHTVLNDHPGYGRSEPIPSEDSTLKSLAKEGKVPKESPWKPDWGDPESRELFLKRFIEPKLKDGIDAWWIDGWGADGLLRNDQFFRDHKDADPMSLGVRGFETLSPQMWLNYFYYETTRQFSRKRPLILSRWGGIGSHRYPVWFSGDTYSTWKTLAFQVEFTATAGNVLTFYWSHDIGGFIGKNLSKELYIRWVQFGTFSPIFRTHSAHGIREPWSFGKKILQIFRKYVRLRYHLAPLWYSLAFQGYLESLPIIRALYHNYPEEKESFIYPGQYMIGDSILVAPITKSMRNRPVIGKIVYFPEGTWFSLESSNVYRGRWRRRVPVSLDKIPVFIKDGAIIPCCDSIGQVIETSPRNLRIDIFPSREETSFNYYEDDGISDDYQQGKYLRLKISCRETADRIEIHILPECGIPAMKSKDIILVIHHREKIVSCKTSSRTVPLQKENTYFGILSSHLNSHKVTLRVPLSSETELFFGKRNLSSE